MTAKVYLAGPIHNMSKKQMSDWRERAKKQLGKEYHILDPTERIFDNKLEDYSKLIVCLDKQNIDECDILLVNADNPSWGTAMEVLYGYMNNKVIISFSKIPKYELSPWITYHSTKVYDSLYNSTKFIRKYL